MTAQAPMGQLCKRSDLRSTFVVGTHLAFVLLPVYLAVATPEGPVWLLSWLWFGLSNNAMLNLMHEAAHLHVFKSHRGSMLLGRWVLGPLMFVSFDRYRSVHWPHHRHLGGAGDPKYSYMIDIGGFRFVTFLLRSMGLVEAWRKLRYVHGERGTATTGGTSEHAWVWRTLLVQGVLVGSLVLTAGQAWTTALRQAALAYGFVYLYGMLSLTVMAANLRAIAEHQITDHQAEVVGHAALRNLACSSFARVLFGAYGFAEHASHHWNPAVPYYRLGAELRRSLLDHPQAAASRGYFRTIAGIVLDKPLRRRQSGAPSQSSR